ncbi:hypothetical protein N8077_04290 [Myxococcota bacterium]|nr:hypothetical protein [Myxococcota bacterium]
MGLRSGMQLSLLLIGSLSLSACATFELTSYEIYCPKPNELAVEDLEAFESANDYPHLAGWVGGLMNACWPEVVEEVQND